MDHFDRGEDIMLQCNPASANPGSKGRKCRECKYIVSIKVNNIYMHSMVGEPVLWARMEGVTS